MNERLEEIREHEIIADNECGEYERHKVDFYYEHVGWLIEQAERVEIVSDTLNQEVKYSAKLEQQNKRYRGAIELALREGAYGDCDNAIDKIYGILGEALE